MDNKTKMDKYYATYEEIRNWAVIDTKKFNEDEQRALDKTIEEWKKEVEALKKTAQKIEKKDSCL